MSIIVDVLPSSYVKSRALPAASETTIPLKDTSPAMSVADTTIKGSKAYIGGNIKLKSSELMATDLRASVCLILAALIAKGKSTINRIYHLDRGYESIEKKLRKVGAKIKRKS